MADKNKSATARIAFTLPISCQICLGKVKQPVVCANNHVFCGPCMDVWLERNQQCPTCRCSITAEAPAKKILGGLSQSETADDSFRNKQLRRSRVELLFKEYEDEFEKLRAEFEVQKHENAVLKKQVAAEAEKRAEQTESEKKSKEEMASDVNVLMMLTKKLHELQTLYDRTKENAVALKKENNALKDEQINANRESQRLRLELANRSPRKYGRITAAALESKLETSEKQIQQLQKALECSDVFVEDAQKELRTYKQTLERIELCSTCSRLLNNPKLKLNHRASHAKTVKPRASPVFSDLGSKVVAPANGKKTPSSPVSSVSFYGKRPSSSSSSAKQTASHTFKEPETCKVPKSKSAVETSNLNKMQANAAGETSFELDLPSPVCSDSGLSPNKSLNLNSSADFTANSTANDTFAFTADSPTVESCCKKLKFDDNQDKKPCIKQEMPKPCSSGEMNKMVTFSDSVDERELAKKAQGDGKASETKIKQSITDTLTFSSPESSDDELDPNMSMTSDIAECMRLLDEAEKKVDSRKELATDSSSSKWNSNKPLLNPSQIKSEFPTPAGASAMPPALPSVSSLFQSSELPYPAAPSAANTVAQSCMYTQPYQTNAAQAQAAPPRFNTDLTRQLPPSQMFAGDAATSNMQAGFASNIRAGGLVGGQMNMRPPHPPQGGNLASTAGAYPGQGAVPANMRHPYPGPGNIHNSARGPPIGQGGVPASVGVANSGQGGVVASTRGGYAGQGAAYASTSGVQPAQGGVQTSLGGAYPSQPGVHTSTGVHPSQGGAQTSMAGAYSGQGAAHTSTGGPQASHSGILPTTSAAVPQGSTGISNSSGGVYAPGHAGMSSVLGVSQSGPGVGLTGTLPSTVAAPSASSFASTGMKLPTSLGVQSNAGGTLPSIGSIHSSIMGGQANNPGIPTSISDIPGHIAAVSNAMGLGPGNFTSADSIMGNLQPSIGNIPVSMGSTQSGGVGTNPSMDTIPGRMDNFGCGSTVMGTSHMAGGLPGSGGNTQFRAGGVAGAAPMKATQPLPTPPVQSDDDLKQGIASILARHSMPPASSGPSSLPTSLSNLAQFDLAFGPGSKPLNRQQNTSFGASYANAEQGDVLYQRRPASTDALERMLNRVSSLETEVRPASVPLPPPLNFHNKSNFAPLPSFDNKAGSFWNDQSRFSSSGMTLPMDTTPNTAPSMAPSPATALPSLSSIFQKSQPPSDFMSEKSAPQLNPATQSTLLNGHMNSSALSGMGACSSAGSTSTDLAPNSTAPPVTFANAAPSGQSLSQPLPMELGSSLSSWKSQ